VLDAAAWEKVMATSSWATQNDTAVRLYAPPHRLMTVVESPSIPV
jgi:hypothetical protein